MSKVCSPAKYVVPRGVSDLVFLCFGRQHFNAVGKLRTLAHALLLMGLSADLEDLTDPKGTLFQFTHNA